MKGHGTALHKGVHKPSLLYRKLADTIFQHPHTPQIDGTVFGRSGNRISISFRRSPRSGLRKASRVGSLASSFHISKASEQGKDIWGTFRRRHGSCAVPLGDRKPSDVHNQNDRKVEKFHKATEGEVQSCHSDS